MSKQADLQNDIYHAMDMVHALDGHKPKTKIEDLVSQFPEHLYVRAYQHAVEALTKAREAKNAEAAT